MTAPGMGMGGFGGPGGPFAPGGPGNAAAAQGLPFAGIPPEYAGRIAELLADEPDLDVPDVPFRHSDVSHEPFSLRRFLAPHAGAIAAGVGLVVLETIALQIGPLLVQRGIDHGVLAGDRGVLVRVFLLYAGAILAHAAIASGRIRFTGRLGQRLMLALRLRVFAHLQRLSLDFYTREKAGRIMTRMTSDIPALAELFQEGVVNLAVQAMTLIVVVAILFVLNAKLAWVVIAGVVPVMVALTLWFRRESTRRYGAVRERIADVLADLQESLAGVRVVSLHNRQRHNVVRHRNVLHDYRDANLRAAHAAAVYGPGSNAVGVLGQTLVLAAGGGMAYAGTVTVGELAAFVLYLTAFFAPIQQLAQLHNTYQQGQAAAAKLRELLSTPPSVREAPAARTLADVRGALSLEHVTFGYAPGEPVLRDVSLEIAAGETFALVGETGAGKSTIAKLLARFYDPDQGRVRIDGVDLRDVRIESLRRTLGVVPQEPFLFAGTIADNIAFARPGARDEDVWEACRAVGIEERIARLPHGIHTPCHERGVTLSAGERQLIALARAFLAQPRVLILDEATSNLDLRTEALVETALGTLVEGRTAVLIAHRLSTAMRADRIAVVHDGRIDELGSHEELRAGGGRYAALCATWMRAAARDDAGGNPTSAAGGDPHTAEGRQEG